MKLYAWLNSAMTRIYPATPPNQDSRMKLTVACNERFQFQVAVRQTGLHHAAVSLQAEAPKDWKVRIRRVGYVPLPHFNIPVMPSDDDLEGRNYLPGLVPDPLFDDNTILMGQEETHAFWITVIPAAKTTPGPHVIKLHAEVESGPHKTLSFIANVTPMLIPVRRNFMVTNWFYIDTLLDRYQTTFRDQRFWDLLTAYLNNLTEHGQDTVYTSVFSVQLDGERSPSQLLRIKQTGAAEWQFDWRDVRRFVNSAKAAGIRYFEWSHFFSQWGVERAIKVYKGQGENKKLLWPRDTSATSPVYRRFLKRFLPSFHAFLKKERLLECSLFHVSDEPSDQHLENYRRARAMLHELAPWMKVMDAMSHIEVAALTDTPVPSISHALDFLNAGMDCWCYFCCAPREKFLNRLMDTPLTKIRMSGWLFYRWPFKGFLHWGYNYWNRCQKNDMIDPYFVSDAGNWPGWPYGDTFLVYPGANGPVDSIRWEVFADSLQDYALLQATGTPRNGPLLKDIQSFEDFPKNEQWIQNSRRKLLLT